MSPRTIFPLSPLSPLPPFSTPRVFPRILVGFHLSSFSPFSLSPFSSPFSSLTPFTSLSPLSSPLSSFNSLSPIPIVVRKVISLSKVFLRSAFPDRKDDGSPEIQDPFEILTGVSCDALNERRSESDSLSFFLPSSSIAESYKSKSIFNKIRYTFYD